MGHKRRDLETGFAFRRFWTQKTMHPTFTFEVPFDVWSKADGGEKERRIGGICSTDQLDRQNEIILQKGLDFQPFLDHGWFNDNHIGSMEAVLGYPTTVELRKASGREGWYVEGYLLKGYPRSEAVWMLAHALQKTGHRRLGFSVEGGVLERAPDAEHIVRKAVVRHVAITHCPVNTATSLEVLAKSLAAGAAVPMPRNEPAPSSDGRILSPQSIEASPVRRRKRRKKGRTPEEERALTKADHREPLTRREAIALLKALAPGLPEREAHRIVEHAIRFH
jgi:hypothetical protein